MSNPRYISPLRYPGGKASMAPWLGEMFAQQSGRMDIELWVEPFAGGAGAALTLLDREAVGEAWLVDANPGIAAFWHAVVTDGEALARRVETTTPDLTLWEQARETLARHHDDDHAARTVDATDPGGVGRSIPMTSALDPFELGYAAFIVNRCSRSGIVSPTGSVMGGRRQDGPITLADRFNATALADRIRHVHSMRNRLRVFEGDGISFIEDVDDAGVGEEMLFFVDPPYIREGNRLYANGLDEQSHARLARALNGTGARWMLTYDDEPIVSERLYPERRVLAYDIRNTANRARVAREFAVFSDNLDIRGLAEGLTHAGARSEFIRERAAA